MKDESGTFMFPEKTRIPECEGCKGDRCDSVKCDAILFPVLNRKLDALLAWKKWMCGRTEQTTNPLRTCSINGMIIFERTSDQNCRGCIYH